jgi:hypothetical protein
LSENPDRLNNALKRSGERKIIESRCASGFFIGAAQLAG